MTILIIGILVAIGIIGAGIFLLRRNPKRMTLYGECPHCFSRDIYLQEKVHDGDNVVEVYECRQCKHSSVRER